MNLVKQIMDQLPSGALAQISSLLGLDQETIERATSAAVPSMLSALAGLGSSDDGARRISDTLANVDTGGLNNITQLLSGNASSVLSKGTSLLTSLFGEGMVARLADTLGRFAGLNANSVKTLLAYLAPAVLGNVAAQWKNQGGTSQALQSLLVDQRQNFANALPAGLSLDDIPGADDVRPAVHGQSRKVDTKPVTSGSPARWLLPLAALLLGGFLLWQFLARPDADDVTADRRAQESDRVVAMRPEIPSTEVPSVEVPSGEVPNVNIQDVRQDLTGLMESLGTTLTDIRDAESAERAAATLRRLNTQIDAMDRVVSRLPQQQRAALQPLVEEQAKVATERAAAVNAIDGIGADIKALIQEIVTKISRWMSPATP
jgi:hypothetical protein